MISRAVELMAIPFRGARRAAFFWALGMGVLVVLTVAFWPAFREETELADIIEGMPPELVEAFGLADFGSPAGFLRGNLYAVLVPLLLAIAGVVLANGQTASDEDSGRMEAYLAQPVSRAGVFVGRMSAVLAWLLLIGAVVLVANHVSDLAFDLDIEVWRLVATVALCTLLGALHAGLAAIVAGATARPGLVLGIGLAVAIFGYVAFALFPLSDVLEPWRHASPWDWALGGDPLVNETEAWRYLALAIPAALLTAVGAWAFGRRDVRSA